MSNIMDLFDKIAKNRSAAYAEPPAYIVAGLGNPGDKYVKTRHNAGFAALGILCDKLNVKCNKLKFKALTCDAEIAGRRVLLMAPQTYMNNSGESIREAADFYKIPPENIVILFDDISLEPGRIRIRPSGSDGGHNGLKSIIYHLNSNAFPRVKIGVGAKPHPDMDLADWVLGAPNEADREAIHSVMDKAILAVELIVGGDVNAAMNRCNVK